MRPKHCHDPEEAGLDPQLIAACRQGDRGALGEVLRAHAADVSALLSRLAGPRGDIEDLLQTTLLNATHAFPRFRGESSVKTWLCRIAVHVFHDHLRRQRRSRYVPLELVGGREPVDTSHPGADRAYETRQRMHRLYHHLDALPPKRRIPLVLHVLEGRPIGEVAQLMGIGALATRSRLFWARRQLMQRLRADPWFRDLPPVKHEPEEDR